jgi:hypothetical protein
MIVDQTPIITKTVSKENPMKMCYFVFALLLAVLAAAAIGRSAFAQDGCTTDPATGKVT